MSDIARTTAPGLSAGMPWPEFLRPLLATIRNPPGPDDFRIRVAAIAHALPEVTADMRSLSAQRTLMQAAEFWPTPKEVRAVFADAIRHAAQMRALRLPAPEPEPEPGPRTLDEILAARAKAAEAIAILRAVDEPPGATTVRPAYLSGEMLARARDNPLVRAAKAMQQRERERADA